MTAAATTGPARHPRPTSSTPATCTIPKRRAAFSSARDARALVIVPTLPELGPALLFHTRRLSAQIAQEIQLRAANLGAANDFNLVDDRRMQRKDAFDALPERHFAHREGRARAAPMHADHHA